MVQKKCPWLGPGKSLTAMGNFGYQSTCSECYEGLSSSESAASRFLLVLDVFFVSVACFVFVWVVFAFFLFRKRTSSLLHFHLFSTTREQLTDHDTS